MKISLASAIAYPETPKGKRSVRTNIYGNTVAYVSGRRFWEFGCGASSNADADLFVKGYSLEEINNGTAYEKEGLLS
jgi:hypothetical protein